MSTGVLLCIATQSSCVQTIKKCPHMLRSDHRGLRNSRVGGGWWWVMGGMRANTETSHSSARAGASTTMSIYFTTLTPYTHWLLRINGSQFDQFYGLKTQSLSWAEARDHCSAKGAATSRWKLTGRLEVAWWNFCLQNFLVRRRELSRLGSNVGST